MYKRQELDGWDSETNAGRLLRGLGLKDDILYERMSSLADGDKVKVLLAQALFGNPEIVLLDEPTNELDLEAVAWLEEFLIEYPGNCLLYTSPAS